MTITLLMSTACGEEQRSLPVMQAASALQATGQSPANPFPPVIYRSTNAEATD
jgi:hypothetical protein